MFKLLIEAPNGAAIASLNGERTTLGRAGGNDVVLDDLHVSRSHAVIERQGGFHIVRDLHSRNGLFLNGRRIHAKALAAGDLLVLGDCRVRLVHEEDCDEIEIGSEEPAAWSVVAPERSRAETVRQVLPGRRAFGAHAAGDDRDAGEEGERRPGGGSLRPGAPSPR